MLLLDECADSVPDYCAEVPYQRWIIVFDGMYRSACFSPETCALVTNSSRSSPGSETAFPSGSLLPYAEANPNLYKSYAVYAPQCSSDLWAGNASTNNPADAQTSIHFRGRAIAKAILEDLRAGGLPGGGSLANAQAVTIIAPAGLAVSEASITGAFAGLSSLADWALAAPAKSAFTRANITAVCDGCLLTSFGVDPLSNGSLSPGALPADALLRRALPVWQPGSSPASVDAFSPASVISGMAAASPMRVLVQSQLADAQQLAALSAWPPAPGARWTAYALNFSRHTVAALQRADAAGLFSFGAACAQPSAMLANSSFLYTAVPHIVQPGVAPVLDPLRTALPSFLAAALQGQPRASFGLYLDNCSTAPGATSPLCNPSNCAV